MAYFIFADFPVPGMMASVFAVSFIFTLTKLRRKLFSKEDPCHIHKTLGVYSMTHFVYRFSQVGATDMGFTSSWFSLATLAPHVLLSLSSFIFHIPKKRILEGSRIWPEYRMHHSVRTYHCGAISRCMSVGWCILDVANDASLSATAGIRNAFPLIHCIGLGREAVPR